MVGNGRVNENREQRSKDFYFYICPFCNFSSLFGKVCYIRIKNPQSLINQGFAAVRILYESRTDLIQTHLFSKNPRLKAFFFPCRGVLKNLYTLFVQAPFPMRGHHKSSLKGGSPLVRCFSKATSAQGSLFAFNRGRKAMGTKHGNRGMGTEVNKPLFCISAYSTTFHFFL